MTKITPIQTPQTPELPPTQDLLNPIGKKRIRRTSYVWTINNPTELDIQELSLVKGHQDLRYMIFQGETGESGTKHLQGYSEFHRAIDLTVVKTLMTRAHLEVRRGSREQARHYCMKPCSDANCQNPHCQEEREKNHIRWLLPEEYGEWKLTAGKDFWSSIIMMIEQGRSNYEIIQEYPNAMSMQKNMKDYRKEMITHYLSNGYVKKPWIENREVEVYYLYGNTGVGKTWGVRQAFQNKVYTVDFSDKHPWDNYMNQIALLIDEFTHEKADLQMMLRILDKYPVQLPCRYENKWLNVKYIFVVSNIEFYEQYKEVEKKLLQAFSRRFNAVLYMHNRNKITEVSSNDEYKSISEVIEE